MYKHISGHTQRAHLHTLVVAFFFVLMLIVRWPAQSDVTSISVYSQILWHTGQNCVLWM